MLWPRLKDLETSNTEYNNINDANTLALRRAAYYQMLVQIIQLKRWYVLSVIVVVSTFLWLYDSAFFVILLPLVFKTIIANKEKKDCKGLSPFINPYYNYEEDED